MKQYNIEDEATKTALEYLEKLLAENEAIIAFKQIAKKIETHPEINQWIEEIKLAQKAAVNYEYYEKPNAQAEASQKADDLTEKLNQHPLVKEYRHRLSEADEIIQYVTQSLTEQINEQVDKMVESD